MAGGPRRGPPSETSLGGNRQGEPSSSRESPESHQVEKRPSKQTDLPGEDERQQGQKKKKDQNPHRRWPEGYTQSPRQKRRQRNVEPSSPQSRPKDDKKPTPRTGRKNAPKSPTLVIPSLEIRTLDSDPKRVTPS